VIGLQPKAIQYTAAGYKYSKKPERANITVVLLVCVPSYGCLQVDLNITLQPFTSGSSWMMF
jgi:hypothetical protein